MKLLMRQFAGFLAACCLFTLSLHAQAGLGGPQVGSDAAFLKIFENFKGFSAAVEVKVEQAGHGSISFPASMEFSERKARLDMDLSKMQSAEMPAGAMQQLKAMGMAVMYTLTIVDKHEIYIVYPDLKAYARMPMPTQAEKKADATPALASVDIGSETLAGHPCIKRKVTVALEGGKVQEFLVWSAKDLKEFPLKLEMTQDNAHVTMVYSSVKLEAPAATRFVVPVGFASYTNVQQLMQAEMMKRMMQQGMPSQ